MGSHSPRINGTSTYHHPSHQLPSFSHKLVHKHRTESFHCATVLRSPRSASLYLPHKPYLPFPVADPFKLDSRGGSNTRCQFPAIPARAAAPVLQICDKLKQHPICEHQTLQIAGNREKGSSHCAVPTSSWSRHQCSKSRNTSSTALADTPHAPSVLASPRHMIHDQGIISTWEA